MFNKLYVKIKKFLKENYQFIISIIFIIALFNYELPFVIYKSGGIINLKDRVVIDTPYTEDGNFNMSYVTAMKGTIPFILASFILPDWDIYTLSSITNEDSYEDVIETGKVYMNEGIDNAIIAAFNASSYGIKITKTINKVYFLSNEAKTDVIVGDELISVNKHNIASLNDLKEYINTLDEGDIVKIKVINNNKNYTREAKLYKDKSDNTLKIGVAFKTSYEYETEIPVSVKMNDNESGSSGGLMMALQIYNALTKEDITKGYNIAGTGSINSDGTVDEIGGVKYKVLGASKNNIDIFFCPKENYKEAMDVKNKRDLDLEIVKVNTLLDAINYLNNL